MALVVKHNLVVDAALEKDDGAWSLGPPVHTETTITGTSGRDWIHVSGDGNNPQPGSGFNEITTATDGADTISGADGDDVIYGGGGKDTIDGGTGADTIYGGDNADTITGGTGGNTIDGGAGDDTINAGTGLDTVNGGTGNDIIFGSGVSHYYGDGGDDIIAITTTGNGASYDGGAGTDTLRIDDSGQFAPSGLQQSFLLGATFSSFEKLAFNTTHDSQAIFLAPQFGTAISPTMTIQGSANVDQIIIAAPTPGTYDFSAANFTFTNWTRGVDAIVFAAANTPGNFTIIGSAGSEVVAGAAGDDTLNPGSGTDVALGNDGNDTVVFTTGFDATDVINGGNGTDTLQLNGDYNLTLGAKSLLFVENIVLASGHNYAVTSVDANVGAGETLTIDASALTASRTLTFDGHAEKDGSFDFIGGKGADVLTGGSKGDVFDLTKGGADVAKGGGGGDSFLMGALMTAAQQIDGGGSSDTVELAGKYTGLTFGATTMVNVETLLLDDGFNYTLKTNDATVAAGQTLTLDATNLTTNKVLFDGSAETDGKFVLQGGGAADTLIGGSGADTLTGGGGADTLTGGLGADRLTGGAGHDTLVYAGALDSTSSAYDTVKGFDFSQDKFDTTVTVNHVDTAITTGALSKATFDTDLASAVGAAQLGVNHAVLFTASSGDLAGKMFLVVDVGGGAGYQAHQDLVILLDSPTHLGSIGTADFI